MLLKSRSKSELSNRNSKYSKNKSILKFNLLKTGKIKFNEVFRVVRFTKIKLLI